MKSTFRLMIGASGSGDNASKGRINLFCSWTLVPDTRHTVACAPCWLVKGETPLASYYNWPAGITRGKTCRPYLGGGPPTSLFLRAGRSRTCTASRFQYLATSKEFSHGLKARLTCHFRHEASTYCSATALILFFRC